MSSELHGVDFEESYYGHNCTIQERKSDVLKTDIRGGNLLLRKLKRWWHGLFLVSYKDERTKIYYTSSEAMRMDRVRQFRFFKGRIHPLSKFRTFWDALVLALFILDEFMIHHNFSYIHGRVCMCFYWIGAIIELFIMADVIINLNTGYIDHETRRIVMEKQDAVMRYCCTKLFLHVASGIPVQWILILRHGLRVDCDLCKTNSFVFTLRALTVFRLFRIYEYSSYWTRARKNFVVSSAYRFLRVFVLGFLTLLFVQDIGDFTSLAVMIHNKEIKHNSYTSIIIYGTFVMESSRFSMNYLFIVSILRAVRVCFGGVRFYSDDFHIDRLVALIAIVIVCIFYVWGLSEVFSLITGLNFVENSFHEFKINAHNLIYCHQLNESTAKRVDEYYDFEYSHMDVIERHNLLVSALPGVLKRESALASYRRHVRRVPHFAEWPPAVTDQLALMMTRETYLGGDLVAEAGVPSEGLSVVAAGELAVFAGGEERGHLIDGDCFGELALVTDRELRTSSVYAISNCVILMLDKYCFRYFMRDHQDLFEQLRSELKEKYRKITTETKSQMYS